MKNLITLLLLLCAFTSNAQRTLFGGNNNYVAPEIPATLITTDLLLYLDADNPASYPGTGNTWYDLSTNSNNGTIGALSLIHI